MPFEILEISPRQFRVLNTRTGKVYTKRTTEQKARTQLRILRRYELRKRVAAKTLSLGYEKEFLDIWWALSPDTYLKSRTYFQGRGESMLRHLLARKVQLFNSIAERVKV